MNHRLTSIVLTASIVGGLLTFMDGRHASAMEVRDLTEVIKASEIGRLEYMIEELDRRIRRVKRIPDVDRNQFERDDLIDMEARKEFLLRDLDRLEESS